MGSIRIGAGAVMAAVALLLVFAPVMAAEHTDDPEIEGEDLGTVVGTAEVDTPSDLYMYYEAYVAADEQVTVGGIEDWEPVEVDETPILAPDQIWTVQLGGEPQLFSDSAEVDMSAFDPGGYYLFFWGCDTIGITGGATVPGDCQWIEPFYVDLEQEENVTVTDTNSPIDAGDTLTVETTVENPGDEEITRTLNVVAGGLLQQTSENMTIQPGEEEMVEFEFNTSQEPTTRIISIVAETEHDTDYDAATVYGTEDNRTAADEDIDADNITVSITDTDSPVHAGASLGVTADITNTMDESVDFTARFTVGHDEETMDRQYIHLPPNTTQSVEFSFDTYPARLTSEFPVRVSVGHDQDTETVTVYGTEDEQVAGDVSLDIDTFDDDVHAGETVTVVPEIENRGNETRVLSPRLLTGEDDTEHDREELILDPDETGTVEFTYETDTAEETTDLPMAVEVADQRVELESTVYGTGDDDAPDRPEDTDDPEDPADDDDDTDDPADDGDDDTEEDMTERLTISEVNAPVRGGDTLELTAELTNNGGETIDRTVDLIVGYDEVDGGAETVTAEPNETETIDFTFETYPARLTTQFPMRVETANDHDEEIVTVYGTEDENAPEDLDDVNESAGDVGLFISHIDTPVDAGDEIDIEAEIANSQDEPITRAPRLIVGHDRIELDQQDVTVEPGERETVEYVFETYPAQLTTEFPIAVETDNKQDERYVTVYGTDDDEEPIEPADDVGGVEPVDDETDDETDEDDEDEHRGLQVGDEIEHGSWTLELVDVDSDANEVRIDVFHEDEFMSSATLSDDDSETFGDQEQLRVDVVDIWVGEAQEQVHIDTALIDEDPDTPDGPDRPDDTGDDVEEPDDSVVIHFQTMGGGMDSLIDEYERGVQEHTPLGNECPVTFWQDGEGSPGDADIAFSVSDRSQQDGVLGYVRVNPQTIDDDSEPVRGELYNSVAVGGETFDPVPEVTRQVVAHEVLHVFSMCDEYSEDRWQDGDTLYPQGCVNPWEREMHDLMDANQGECTADPTTGVEDEACGSPTGSGLSVMGGGYSLLIADGEVNPPQGMTFAGIPDEDRDDLINVIEQRGGVTCG